MRSKLILTALLTTIAYFSFGQKGIISGHVKEKLSGEDAIGANIVIDGTSIGATTDISGKFSFSVEAGTYKLITTYIGFQKLIVDSLVVKAGEELKIELQLDSEDQQLQEVVITGTADKTSESFLLVERKNAVEFVQNIGAIELSRKGVSNAEAAVTQVTGVSKQEGVKNVFVRGLGDRYNSTSLNNLPLPSEDPEYKNITLDFFSSDIINSIDVNKTFGANIFGDVTGANVNIVSKQLFEDREFKVNASIGVNSQTVSQDFYRADGANFLGTADRNVPISNLKDYSFDHSFQPNKVSGPLANLNLSLSGGKTFNVGRNVLRTFIVGAMGNDYLFKKGQVRQVSPTGGIRQDFDYSKSEYNASQIGLASVSYDFGEGNRIFYNTMYIHDNKQSVGNYEGFTVNGNDDISDPNAYKSFVRRQQQNNNTLLVNQLISAINLNENLKLDVGGSFNVARGDEPDRRSSFYVFDGDGYRVNTNSPAFNHRFYSSLKENDIAANASVTYKFDEESNNKITIGYNFRSTNRDFSSTQFNFDFPSPATVSVDNPDALFNQQSIDNGTFEMETGRGTGSKALIPFTYTGDRMIHAAIANAVFDVTPQLTVNVGARYEKIRQEVGWDTNLDERNPNIRNDNTEVREPSYFLPSLNIKYNISDDNIVRLASSKSYTMPQFKEVAPFYYEDVNVSSFGNPKLLPAENFNVDLRYEHYFKNKELIAVTVFYKRIKNAINRVQVASAANELSYVNTGNADAAGVELEVRKGLYTITNKNDKNTSLDVGLNVSYLYSKQDLKDVPTDDLAFQPTNKTSALEGASPWLVNSDITFNTQGQKGRSLTTALVFNFFSDRIYSIGAPVGNQHIYENGIPRLDFISKIGLSEKFSLSLNVRNILNPNYRLTKKVDSGANEIISDYRKGLTTSLGFTYKF